MRVMVTQTWAWLHAQLDMPEYKHIKVHALRSGTNLSLCGLENHHDEGDMPIQFFLTGSATCKKCKRTISD